MIKTISIILAFLLSFPLNILAGEPVDLTKKLINSTNSKLTIKYIECTNNHTRTCSKEKAIELRIGEIWQFNDQSLDFEITQITNGIYIRNLGTTEQIKANPKEAKFIPRCRIKQPLVITQHGSEYFCERAGM
jgi:hypothetical protein